MRLSGRTGSTDVSRLRMRPGFGAGKSACNRHVRLESSGANKNGPPGCRRILRWSKRPVLNLIQVNPMTRIASEESSPSGLARLHELYLKLETDHEKSVGERIMSTCPELIVGMGRNPVTGKLDHIRIRIGETMQNEVHTENRCVNNRPIIKKGHAFRISGKRWVCWIDDELHLLTHSSHLGGLGVSGYQSTGETIEIQSLNGHDRSNAVRFKAQQVEV